MQTLSDILTTMHQLKKLYEKMSAPLCERHGLSQTGLDILAFLSNHPAYDTASDFVEMRLIAKSHVSKSVEGLLQQGLLARQPDGRDRRCVHLLLTKAADPLVEEVHGMQRRFVGRLYQGLSPGEEAQFMELLGRVSRNIRKAYEEG